jgi:hypothetical protein
MLCRTLGHLIRRGVRLGLFASALACGGMLAAGLFSEPVRGSGNFATEERPIRPVQELVIADDMNATISQGSFLSLQLTADDNILPLLETRQSCGKLSLRSKSGYSLHPLTPVVAQITLPQFSKLTVSGTGNVQGVGLTTDELTVKLSGAANTTLTDLTCRKLTVNVSGAGTTTISGIAEKLVVQLSGAGDLDATGLKAAYVETRVSGAGSAKIWATDDLKMKVSGAGAIEYKGNPKIERKISGSGSVKYRGA